MGNNLFEMIGLIVITAGLFFYIGYTIGCALTKDKFLRFIGRICRKEIKK